MSEERNSPLGEPNYREYTLAQLLDVERHIDVEAYPERAARVRAEIDKRRESSTKGPSPSREPLPMELTKRGLGILMIVSGAYSLLSLLDAIVSAERMRGLWFSFALTVFFFGGMVISGIALSTRQRFGIHLAIAVMILQVPIIRIGRLAYQVRAWPASEVYLWPPITFDFSLAPGFAVSWLDAPGETVLGINIIASAVVGVLAEHHDRHRRALRRLASQGPRDPHLGDG